MGRLAVSATLSEDDVCRIHQQLCLDFLDTEDPIDPPGIRSAALLQSAVGRQESGWSQQLKYPTALMNAATLTYGICMDHPFYNGNKRTALVAMLAHLDGNRLALHDTKQSELFDLMLDVAQSRLSWRNLDARSLRGRARPTSDEEVAALADWLARRTHVVTRGEREITFRQLIQVLRSFGFEVANPRNNTIDILRPVNRRRGMIRRETVTDYKRIGSIPYPGDGKTVGARKLKEIRRLCHLTEEHGVDSASFYGGADAIDVFINRYRTVLRRLARR